MSKRKFDYMEFNYGGSSAYIFDASVYTKKQAIEIYFDEMCCETDEKESIQIEEEYVKWKPNLLEEEMWYFDLEERKGMYITCNKNEKRAFKCWKVFI